MPDEENPDAGDQTVEVQNAELPEVEDSPPVGPGGQVDILLDTALTVSASLGETEIEVRDLLQLGAGSVLKLDRRVGEPVDLVLRGIKFAKGVLVVVGDRLGVRIKEILPPAERAEGDK
jgi:flagellar motor switch protein FliN/FliY